MQLIVGLGNPGEQYKGTRHNLGFEVLDEYVRKQTAGEWSREDKFKAEIIKINSELSTPNSQLILAKPFTFMNNSGQAVASITKYFKIKPEDILIIHDELDLELGHIKMRLGGAAAGHHGVEDVIEKLGTDKFARLRLGIGVQKAISGEHKAVSFNAEQFVLESFMQIERSTVKRMIKRSLDALDILFEKGLDKAQNQFN